MAGLKDDLLKRGWLLKGSGNPNQPPATHLFLDGGKAAIPDEHAGTFLNMYTNALLRGETVYVVELKTSAFRLFFDVDMHVAEVQEASYLETFAQIHKQAFEFWCLPPTARMVVCAAPLKKCEDGTTKVGYHIYWPDIIVNAPIALAFRSHLIDFLSSEWADILDPCVFKGNGIRMVYSDKAPGQQRPYVPCLVVEGPDGAPETLPPWPQSALLIRTYAHDLSVRTFGVPLTHCKNGIDQLADDAKFGHFKPGEGATVRLDSLPQETLKIVHASLPKVFETQQFTGVFRTKMCVMLRSSSRFCQNVGREHRTSTVYFAVGPKGVAQRCYCRKDERGCDAYCSPWYPLPKPVIEGLLGGPAEESSSSIAATEEEGANNNKKVGMVDSLHTMPSKKRFGSGDLHALLHPSSKKSAAAAKKKKTAKTKKRSN